MSNITTVKSALHAEIRHAKQGMAFYEMRIAAMEKMIEQLDQLDSTPGAKQSTTAMGKRAYTRRTAGTASDADVKPVASGKGRKKTKAGRGVSLPQTSGAFWQSLLSATPLSNQELLSAAVAKLSIQPTPSDLKKLKQRLANAVTIMTKNGSMRSQGTGRARRFSGAAA